MFSGPVREFKGWIQQQQFRQVGPKESSTFHCGQPPTRTRDVEVRGGTPACSCRPIGGDGHVDRPRRIDGTRECCVQQVQSSNVKHCTARYGLRGVRVGEKACCPVPLLSRSSQRSTLTTQDVTPRMSNVLRLRRGRRISEQESRKVQVEVASNQERQQIRSVGV